MKILGSNVTVSHDEKTGDVIIRIPTKGEGKPSSTGKSMVHASTEGNKDLGEVAPSLTGFKLGLNFYKAK